MTNSRPTGTRSNGMTRSVSSQPARPTSSNPVPQSNHALEVIQNQVDTFFTSLGEVLNDITALEVNTMVVSEITGHKFNPQDAYAALYAIPIGDVNDPYFSICKPEIPMEVRDRYIDLRRKLRSAYDEYLMQAPDTEHFPDLPNPNDPLDLPRLERLLSDSQFLRSLRKLRELRHLLGGSQAANQNIIDVIAAQTVIQLDGDVLNRFDQRLLQDSNRDFLLNIHKQAVLSGEAQWRGLLKFMIDLLQELIFRRRTEMSPPNVNVPE